MTGWDFGARSLRLDSMDSLDTMGSVESVDPVDTVETSRVVVRLLAPA